jgi:predicted aspartyl protease
MPADALVQNLLANKKEPPVVSGLFGLIDTGATLTVIKEGIAEQLNITPYDFVKINTPTTSFFQCPKYRITIRFPNNISVEGSAIEAPLPGQGIQCLLGRDILSLTTFIYLGHMNQFTLSL